MNPKVKTIFLFVISAAVTCIAIMFILVRVSLHLIDESTERLTAAFPVGTPKEKLIEDCGKGAFECSSSEECTREIHDWSGADIPPTAYGSTMVLYFSDFTGGHACVFLFDNEDLLTKIFCGRS